jgi:hypothetical protein
MRDGQGCEELATKSFSTARMEPGNTEVIPRISGQADGKVIQRRGICSLRSFDSALRESSPCSIRVWTSDYAAATV